MICCGSLCFNPRPYFSSFEITMFLLHDEVEQAMYILLWFQGRRLAFSSKFEGTTFYHVKSSFLSPTVLSSYGFNRCTKQNRTNVLPWLNSLWFSTLYLLPTVFFTGSGLTPVSFTFRWPVNREYITDQALRGMGFYNLQACIPKIHQNNTHNPNLLKLRLHAFN